MNEVVKKGKVALLPLLIRDIFAMIIIIGIFWFIGDIIRFLTTKMVLRQKTLECKTGLIRTQKLDSPLEKVQAVKVESGFWGKIFGYGTLTVTTAGSTVYFRGIAKANAFAAAVNSQIDVASEEKMMRQAKMMAQAMKE